MQVGNKFQTVSGEAEDEGTNNNQPKGEKLGNDPDMDGCRVPVILVAAIWDMQAQRWIESPGYVLVDQV